MSGYCFKDKYLADAHAFVKKRFTGIYWPYLKWSLLFLLMHNVFYHLNIYSDEYGYGGKTSILYTTADFVKRAISVTTQMQGHEQLLGAYWFMKLLFIGSFIFYIALKVLKSKAWGCQSRMVDSLSNCRRSHTCDLDFLLSSVQGQIDK